MFVNDGHHIRRPHPGMCVPVRTLLCILILASVSAAQSQETKLDPVGPSPKSILVLYSFDDSHLFAPLESLKSAIRERVPGQVNFFVEYMETQRLEDPDYEKTLSENLKTVYGTKHLDLVITAVYPALHFALTHRDELFPGTPIVFNYINQRRIAEHGVWPGTTGVTTTVDISGTINLILRLQPNTGNIALVAGSPEFERFWATAVQKELSSRNEGVRITDLVGLSTDELMSRVSKLPENTAILYLVMPKMSEQVVMGSYEIARAIGNQFPTYCIFGNYCLDRGGVGGSIPDYNEQNILTAQQVARIFSGERTEDIPVVHDSGARPMVDSRQLARWRLSESRLPAGSIVLFREPNVWGRYQKYIPAGIAVIIIQVLLIAGLLWQRTRKRSALESLQKLGGLLIHDQEEERARIARELHDDFSQRLAVQHLDLGQLRDKLPESELEERADIQRMIKKTKEMSADLRSLSHRLHSSKLELVGLVPALSGLCQEIQEKHKIAVRFLGYGSQLNLGNATELCLFRVCQEALTNVVRHSEAKSAQVELSAKEKYVSLRISDTGKGFAADLNSSETGIGLLSMRERVRIVGGNFSIRSEPMRGTAVVAEVPIVGANKLMVTPQVTGGNH